MLSRKTLTRAICTSLMGAILCNAAIPELLWTRALLSSGTVDGEGLRKGNSVVLSGDEQSLWLTTETGTLHVMDTNGNSIKTFHPETTADRYTESRSSVSLYPPENPNQSIAFAVYAVIDVPHIGQNGTNSGRDAISSRIISVHGGSSGELGTLRWSTLVQGAIAGTPLISSDGAKIYVIHNTRNWAYVTVLESTKGKIIAEHMDDRAMMKYGPASLVTTAGIDSLYWADALDLGYARAGRVFTIKSTNLTVVRNPQSFASSTTLPPALSKNATSMWLGGRAATVHGWGGNSRKPIWSVQLDRSNRNRSYPIVNRIETDDTEKRLFVSSASNSFHCVDAQNGTLLWSVNSSASVFLTGAKYSSKYNVVYLIEHLSGAVTQHDAATGVANWKFDCRDIGESEICQDSVEADFALSRDGTTLYYGDVYGRINAVRVAFKTTSPSHAPSAAPSLLPPPTPVSMPTPWQSQLPSQLPSPLPTEMPSTAPSDMPSQLPSAVGTEVPSTTPTAFPSPLPSTVPTKLPSTTPSEMPSQPPSSVPLGMPVPTEVPSTTPTAFPSPLPSTVPTKLPSTTLSQLPSQPPSSVPLGMPVPTEVPSTTPTAFPSPLPSTVPTKLPSTTLSQLPSSVPMGMPSDSPFEMPSKIPSTVPTRMPSSTPNEVASQLPSSVSTGMPLDSPPSVPSGATSPRPTADSNPTPQNEPRESNNTTSKPTAAPLPKASAARTCRLSLSTLVFISAAIFSVVF